MLEPKGGARQQNCLELSRAEVDALIIAELCKRHPGALPMSIDIEPRTEGGYCHCWWIAAVCGKCGGSGTYQVRVNGQIRSGLCSQCQGGRRSQEVVNAR